MNRTGSERLSQKSNQAKVYSILEKAESVAQRVLKSIQELASAMACKGLVSVILTTISLLSLIT